MLPFQMAGRAFASWWSLMSPYYTKAYQEMWVGVGIMTYLYYKVSYGGKKKAVKDKPAH
uniref:6.8 kDa mitochondrial proteolipid n=2 Tax=Oreochromis TaxID=8139 RepID=A0A668S7I6_OREAU